jgi:hypothetical protein
MSLLNKMHDFYKGRYSGEEMEKKFNDAVEDLISTGDITRKEFLEFCYDNNIEPITKKKKKSDDGPRMPSYDPCSRGGGGYRGGC